jgi:hypothetical protein
MKTAKKLLCIILAAFMMFALVACSEDTPATDSGSNTPTNQPADTPSGGDDPAPADPDGDDPAGTDDGTPAAATFDNSTYTGPWPDFNAYVPFEYDMNRVIYATGFESNDDICVCTVPRDCGGDNLCRDGAAIWRRRWDPGRSISPMVDGERFPTTVHEFYGDQILEISSEYSLQGGSSLKVANRAHAWGGATLDITEFLLDDVTAYEIFVWVKMPEGSDPGRVLLSRQTDGLDGTEFGQWADYDADEGILSKYRLPVSAANALADDPDAWDSRFPEYHVRDDGWVLFRGTSQIVKMFYDQVQIYLETGDGGNPNLQPLYMDALTIMIAE